MSETAERGTIVVIDDDRVMRLSCSKILTGIGCRVETFEDGLQGLDGVARIKPDLVVVDLKMPGISGMEVISRIHQMEPDIVVIVITGYPTVDSAVEAMKKGAFDFLPKPFSPDELRLIVGRGLEHRRLLQRSRQLEEEREHFKRRLDQLVSDQLKTPLTMTFRQELGLQEVMEVICNEGRRLTGASSSAVLLLDEGTKPRVACTLGDQASQAELIFQAAWPDSENVLPEEPLLLSDIQNENNVFANEKGIRSLLAVPLRLRRSEVGVLLLLNSSTRFSEIDLKIVKMFADQAAIALEYAHLSEQHERLTVMEERDRLARDLHDSVSQSLYAVSLYAEASARLISDGQVSKAAEKLRELRDSAISALSEMRLLLFELRPHLLEEGLVSTLHARLSAVEEHVGLETELRYEGLGRLPAQIEEDLYGIAREALNNALKHAHASSILVELRQDGPVITLEIKDNGRGFDFEAGKKIGGLGLKSMEERARQLDGRLEVLSEEGRGTQVKVEVPLYGES